MNKTNNLITLDTGSTKIYNNVDDENIIINVSKARNIYNKYLGRLKKDDPYPSLGTALACLIAIATGDFHDIWQIQDSGAFLHSAFIIGAIAFGILSCSRLYNRHKNKNLNEEKFIEALKSDKN